MKTLSEIALQYEGVQEIPDNQGWRDKFLGQTMEAVGWQKGWAWCMLFAQVCSELYFAQFNSSLIAKYREVFCPSVVETYRNFKKIYPNLISEKPIEDSIVIWQKYKQGKPTIWGHAAIFREQLTDNCISTIEGNTNKAGNREGDGVYSKVRVLNAKPENGLRILGFIKIPVS